LRIEFRSSFVRDLEGTRDKALKTLVQQTIDQVERAQSLEEIEHLRKLQGADRYYRIRLGDYRIGIVVEKDTVTFVRLLHRKDMYRHFPY
jgi:mRNA-degrading endonuclease RelE of RelBE toxin-antitoxin system